MADMSGRRLDRKETPMFSPSTGYAAIALGYLAQCEAGTARVEQIARERDIPGPYLGKIMHTLGRKGFVRARRGVGGGVTITRDPSKATLLDLCEAMDDPIIHQRCMLGVAECSDERACPAHDFWTSHRRKLIEFARRTTILSIGEFERTRRLKSDKHASSKKQSGRKAAAPSKAAIGKKKSSKRSAK